MARTVIGVMGGGEGAPDHAVRDAYRLGELVALEGWVLLNGGRNAGVMAASAAGARSQGGLVIGILPDKSTHGASEHLDVAIVTGMGNARNVINVLSSDVVISCSGGAGTISEVALALKSGKPVITLNFDTGNLFVSARPWAQLYDAVTPEDAVEIARRILNQHSME